MASTCSGERHVSSMRSTIFESSATNMAAMIAGQRLEVLHHTPHVDLLRSDVSCVSTANDSSVI